MSEANTKSVIHRELDDRIHKSLLEALPQNPMDFELSRDVAYSHVARGLKFIGSDTQNKYISPHYPLKDTTPFLVCDKNEIVRLWQFPDFSCTINSEELSKAKEIFQKMHSRDSSRSDGKMGEGLCLLVMALDKRKPLNEKNDPPIAQSFEYYDLINKAALAFDAARLASENAGPAYLYGALAHFLLLLEQEHALPAIYDSQENWTKLFAYHARKRQAFYRLEHFIDQYLEEIIDGSPNIPNGKNGTSFHIARNNESNPLGFYFDPSDVAALVPDPNSVIAALEKKLSLMPICRALLEAKEFKSDKSKSIEVVISDQAVKLLDEYDVKE